MIKHIVLFKLKSENKEISNETVIADLKSLSEKISELKFLEIGSNFSERKTAHDIILVSHFESKDDLYIYRKHPEHVKVVEKIKPFVEKTAVCDYEI